MRRPVILLGNGVRNNPALVDELCRLCVPVLTTWQAADLVPEDSPVFCGRPGTLGQRAANIIQQKADRLMCLGARLDMEQVGHNLVGFAPEALKIVVDIDQHELAKLPETFEKIKLDLANPRAGDRIVPLIEGNLHWLHWCKCLYARLRPELERTGSSGCVDPYYFVSRLSQVAPEDAVIVPGSSGMQSCAMMQAFKVKRGQRVLLCNTIGAMGMEPMAIGAAGASGKPVIVVTGDGGFAMNVQELETVRREQLPIKYFVFANGGYGSITTMQDLRFGRRVGSDAGSGFTLPCLQSVAQAFGLPFRRITENLGCDNLETYLQQPGPMLIEVETSLDFQYACKVQSTMIDGRLVPDAMENMTPKIDLQRLMTDWGTP
jgi:acetolactate synthase-1/2/3 large subunit